MKKRVYISIHIEGNEGWIETTVLSPHDQKWIADCLLDTFVCDDAFYDPNEKRIQITAWENNLDPHSIQQALPDILRELDRKDYSIEIV